MTEVDPRKRSNIVLLTLIGLPATVLAAAALIPQAQEVRRNLYPDLAACERDYTPQQCQPGNGSAVTGYHGPYYYGNRNAAQAQSDPGPGRAGAPHPVEVSARGGFGAFGRAVSAAA